MFVLQAGTLNEKKPSKINLTIDAGLNELYKKERNIIRDVENKELVNKNAEK